MSNSQPTPFLFLEGEDEIAIKHVHLAISTFEANPERANSIIESCLTDDNKKRFTTFKEQVEFDIPMTLALLPMQTYQDLVGWIKSHYDKKEGLEPKTLPEVLKFAKSILEHFESKKMPAKEAIAYQHPEVKKNPSPLSSHVTDLEKTLAAIESNILSAPANDVQKLMDLKGDAIPQLAAKLEAVGEVPTDLQDRKNDLATKSADLNAAFDEKLQKALDDQEMADFIGAKLDDLKKRLDPVAEKLQSGVSQPLADVDNELQQLKAIIDEINQLPGLENAPQQQVFQVLGQIVQELEKLQNAVREHQNAIDNHSPLVTDSDLDKTLADNLPELLRTVQEQKKNLAEAVQVNTIAPEIKLISAELQQRPAELPENLDDQQAALEDLGARRARLEALMQNIPEGAQGDELREKSQWDHSKLKDLLGQLGAKVGDKLAALAAFNTTRKDAEENLLAIASRPETGKTPEEVIEQLKRDEDALEKLRLTVAQTDRDALDETQAREYDDLIARLQKAENLLKQRRAAAEDVVGKQKATENLHKKTVPALSSLAKLIAEAKSLLNDPDSGRSLQRRISSIINHSPGINLSREQRP